MWVERDRVQWHRWPKRVRRAASQGSPARISAAVGGGFSAALLLMGPGWIEWLVLLAPLTVVPLGLAVALREGERPGPAFWLASRLQPTAGAMAAASFLLPAGAAAAGLTLPWTFVGALAAAAGVGRLSRRAGVGSRLFEGRRLRAPSGRGGRWRAVLDWVFRRRAEETAIDGGLVFLAVGAVWLSISRAGWTPLGFSEVIVLLTAAHFHYAGFAAAVIAGLAGRRLKAAGGPAEGALAASVAGILAGSAAVAAGHLTTPLMELAGSLVLSMGLVLLSSLALIGGGLPERSAARTLAAASFAAPPVSMIFAILYAFGQWTGHPWISIPEMALLHGGLNALVFALAGLLAWNLGPPGTAESWRSQSGTIRPPKPESTRGPARSGPGSRP